MDSNGILQKHWLGVLVAFTIDALLLVLALLSATILRLHDDWVVHFANYLPSLALGALVLPCTCYIAGLYAPQTGRHSLFLRSVLLAVCLLLTVGVLVGSFYVNYSGRIGRGVLVVAIPMTYVLLVAHHLLLLHRARNHRERIGLLATSEQDEEEGRMLLNFGAEGFELVGIITANDYRPTGKTAPLGTITDIDRIAAQHRLDRVLCTNHNMINSALYRSFTRLRYAGVPVMPLINLFEEIHHTVPLELVTPEWLLGASAAPHVFYIRKLKRGFDIVAALGGLVVLGPFMLLGMLAIKLTSRGPVLYRQTRSGRFGRPFEVIKLRSMRLDAEVDGAKWASDQDPRVTWIGGVLRKYRIDEIPQLINVLRGEMSFVGPRPERPEFMQELNSEVPFFTERLMVQPGITGWAQVNYPYGSSVEDAKRKLEFDLYYMKNMSLFLDVFILLDTVRIILRGGKTSKRGFSLPRPVLPGSARPSSLDAGPVGTPETGYPR